MAQWVKDFPHKHEDLSSILQCPHVKNHVWWRVPLIYHWEGADKVPWGLLVNQASYFGEFWVR